MRRKTREVKVGNVGVGGDHPIRIQSMTTSPTHDVAATVEQIIRLADQGCEIARVTVQGKREALACEEIKNALLQKGYLIPLVADIHFYPPAALIVADFVDKVRINPGNFADKRATFVQSEYKDSRYIEEAFVPLVEKCKKLGKALRIGTNHGSLSDRIMSRFGDSPRGMVESALEYTRIARACDYHDLIFSMKASNPVVMIAAYRLLVEEMDRLGWDYPIHLGVTEAGSGQEGRIKSAIGIGALLKDGIGDTIRVSLTEDPWEEIEPCKKIIEVCQNPTYTIYKPQMEKRALDLPPFYHKDGTVMVREGLSDLHTEEQLGRPVKTALSPDLLFTHEMEEKKKRHLEEAGIGVVKQIAIAGDAPWDSLLENKPSALLFSPKGDFIQTGREFFAWVRENKLRAPILLAPQTKSLYEAAVLAGALLTDKMGDGIALLQDSTVGFNILQACRMRSVKTEFISCPSCGRTLFDLQEVTAKVRAATGHLPGVKIAVMGCIVNGPGEMADADFGYVGSGRGKIDLYVGKKCVMKALPASEAVRHLIQLIQDEGMWVDEPLPLSLPSSC